MYKICKTEESAARQKELEYGLMRLMSVRRYEDITVSELCQRLNVPRKSFYRYFSSKDGALYALIDHTLMEFEGYHKLYANGEKRTLHRELQQFFQFWIDHKMFLDALERSGMSGIMIQRAIGHAVSDAVIPNRFLPEDSKEVRQHIMMFGVCGLMSMILNWHHEGYSQTAAQMADVAVRLLSMPLFPEVEKFL